MFASVKNGGVWNMERRLIRNLHGPRSYCGFFGAGGLARGRAVGFELHVALRLGHPILFQHYMTLLQRSASAASQTTLARDGQTRILLIVLSPKGPRSLRDKH